MDFESGRASFLWYLAVPAMTIAARAFPIAIGFLSLFHDRLAATLGWRGGSRELWSPHLALPPLFFSRASGSLMPLAGIICEALSVGATTDEDISVGIEEERIARGA